MTTAELREALVRAGVRSSVYSLDGGLPNDALCLDRVGEAWTVYYSERGSRFDERSFATEDEACRYLLDKLVHESTARLPPSH